MKKLLALVGLGILIWWRHRHTSWRHLLLFFPIHVCCCCNNRSWNTTGVIKARAFKISLKLGIDPLPPPLPSTFSLLRVRCSIRWSARIKGARGRRTDGAARDRSHEPCNGFTRLFLFPTPFIYISFRHLVKSDLRSWSLDLVYTLKRLTFYLASTELIFIITWSFFSYICVHAHHKSQIILIIRK